MTKQTKMTFEQLFEKSKELVIEEREQDFNFCVYVEFDLCASTLVDLQDICYIDEIPDVDDDNEMCFTDFVDNNNLEIFCSGLNIYSVIQNSLFQKPNVTNLELVKALEHYKIYDCFMDF